MSNKRILYLFTRTPLHVGAGSSVGAIDQPIIRERHTGFPIIPATSLKGAFADEWLDRVKVKRKKDDGSEEEVEVIQRSVDGKWLFGETDANNAAAGALQFSEARLLAFPIRSAKGSFAWITCPLVLQRAVRDGVFPSIKPDSKSEPQYLPTKEPADDEAVWTGNTLDLGGSVVLEEYTFKRAKDGQADVAMPTQLAGTLAQKLNADPVWSEVKDRLVILSNGMMSFFAQNACEVAQHVRIDDETGAAAGGALFNQENVPSESLFYSVLHAFAGRGDKFKDKKPEEALTRFSEKLKAANHVFQFGGDASTGLGWCTVRLDAPCSNSETPQT